MENQGINKDLILREQLALQRTRLSNQSTFLAFLRTAMYFLIAGLSVKNFYTIHAADFYENLLLGFAALLFVVGTINYVYQSKLIRQSEMHIGNFQLDYLKKPNVTGK